MNIFPFPSLSILSFKKKEKTWLWVYSVLQQNLFECLWQTQFPQVYLGDISAYAWLDTLLGSDLNHTSED